MRYINLLHILSVAVTAAFATSVSAHSDVLLRSDGSRVVVGAAEDVDGEEGGPFFDLDTFVFEGVFLNPAIPTPPFGFDFERDEPGFFSGTSVTVGQDLPANADVSLSPAPISLPTGTDSVFYWDGAGEVDFQPLASAQPGVSFALDSPTFGSTSAASFLDDHPLFGLTGGAADGVYLASFSAGVEGLEASTPFLTVWLAHTSLVDEATAETLEEALEEYEEGGPEPVVGGVNFAYFEEAVEFAQTVPEPSALLVAGLAAVAGLARRR